MTEKLLLVEDEKNVGSTLVERLLKEGYDVRWATTSAQAAQEIRDQRFDLALLDIGLPDGNGFSVGESLKKAQPSTAIIFITAFGDPEDRVRGLELGAEDYVVKPFHLKELLLRIKNVLKRAQSLAKTPESIQVGRAVIHFARYEAEVEGKTQSLTHKECALLKLLIDRSGLVVSRDAILDHVWSQDEYPTPRTVDNFILRLRKLVEENPENPQIIRSVRGIGYQLAAGPDSLTVHRPIS